MPRHYHITAGPRLLTLSHALFPQSVAMSATFTTPPPSLPNVLLSAPAPHVLLVTLDRPRQLNALPREMHWRLDALWAWYDREPSLRCAVLTGNGRAFCAGADLKEWDGRKNAPGGEERGPSSSSSPPSSTADRGDGDGAAQKWTGNGFGGLSNRAGKKPVIAAVNGLCLGGGFEMAINCDLVLAAAAARFGLPEVTRGVVAIAGALPRLVRTVGRQRASEMALLGRMYSAGEMGAWGVVNEVVPEGGDVVEAAVKWASEMAGNAPDAVIVSREGILGGWEAEGVRESTNRVEDGDSYKALERGENMAEGTRSFVEKRKPVWVDSKL